ncbi:Cytochrome P450 9e2 [Eumeta japonica]|uniref:unspecific monooxygenase n=1 Tax=Eumeta variegata TaxID=151549 RepID=A0A4C2A182_EUMVA|nr:Cytochrome P450 9e2 [Eumeta japonica]
MEYLDKVLNESMRMYPPIGSLNRKCTKNDVLLHGNIKVEEGTLLFIPVYSIHHDPIYYPDLETFDPERFSLEARQSRPKYTYLPFGDGHRVCLAARFARLQMKTGLVHVLRHFAVRTGDAGRPIKYFKLPVQVTPANVDFESVERKLVR